MTQDGLPSAITFFFADEPIEEEHKILKKENIAGQHMRQVALVCAAMKCKENEALALIAQHPPLVRMEEWEGDAGVNPVVFFWRV